MGNSIPLYKFLKKKYGTLLLMDVIYIDDMKANIAKTPVLRENFFSILLILNGEENLTLNDKTSKMTTGSVACGLPGEIWQFNPNTTLSGFNLIFEEEFLLSFFSDRHFLNQFTFLNPSRETPFLHLDGTLFERIKKLFEDMKVEIGNKVTVKDQHILRAMLYETLMLLRRSEVSEISSSSKIHTAARYVDNFTNLAGKYFAEEHCISYYADKLCITSNYLNKIINQALGKSPKKILSEKLAEEAKRLLRYTELSIKEISEKLHFENPSYFVRFFHKEFNITPLKYRETYHEK